MAGLVPAIHVLFRRQHRRTWMPGTRPGMTEEGGSAYVFSAGLPMPKLDLMLSISSTFTPFLRMM